MFISLRWKAVVFVSIALIGLTGAWTWLSVEKQLRIFDEQLEKSYERSSALLNQLIVGSFHELSQVSQLIANNIAVYPSDQSVPVEPSVNVHERLTRDWLMLNVNIGLDYIGIYGADKSTITEITDFRDDNNNNFRQALLASLSAREVLVDPLNYLYCARACYLVNIEPFIDSAGQAKYIATAKSMIEIVRTFSIISTNELAILVNAGGGNSRQVDRDLPELGLEAWAVSNFETMFPVLRSFVGQMLDLSNQSNQVYFRNGSPYLIKQLIPKRATFDAETAVFVFMSDHSANRRAMVDNIKRGIIVGVLGLVITELLLILFINGTIQKLLNISSALYLLPQQRFNEAQNLVAREDGNISDELSLLQRSTHKVAQDLQHLHRELHDKNEFLTEQVSALSRSRAFLTRLFDNSHIFVITQTKEGIIVSANRKFLDLYEAQPMNFSQIIYSDSEAHDFHSQMDALVGRKIDVFQQQMSVVDKDRKNLVITWTHSFVEDEKGNEIILSTGIDQTKQKNAENDLRWMANHDSLTGIGNRRSFNVFVRRLLEQHTRGALVFIDVNRFKQINDIYGHGVGDLVLVAIANKLQLSVRASDKISRFAGDEFTAVLPGVSSDDLIGILQKITDGLNSVIELDNGATLSYSVSVGAALFPEHGNDLETLVVNADMAMYHAKEKGLGRWHVYDHNDDRVVQLKNDNSLLIKLKQAISKQQFRVVYQPIIHIHSKEISHYEALLRLNDESGRPISPGVFIPLAEKTGEIRAIDTWVIDRVVSDLKSLLITGVQAGFAINISAPTLQSGEFAEMVISTIERHQVPPELIIIELTETSYIENFQQVLQNLRKVTAFGVKVALDDFGVGFSSFTYLKKLPLTFVKLDGSYIRNITRNDDDQVFVRSLSAMINAFGMHTVAEFVEDAQTLEMITGLGVSHAQGYHLGRPQEFDICFDAAIELAADVSSDTRF